MKPLIYLVEDDADIARLITRTLEQQGTEVRTFRRLADFQRAVALKAPDLCLVDLSLPDGDGLSVVHGGLPASVPKIIVTGRGQLTDRVVGLEVGADDYIVKPFEPRELAARVKAVLRRSQPVRGGPATASGRIACFGDWTADFEACTLSHSDGEVMQLSAAEATLLSAFTDAPGRVLSRNQLLDATTGRADEPTDRSMDARISRLRKKLRDDPYSPSIIRTVYGAGYVFCPVPSAQAT
ncbi:winged helix-turn-helix domain-containing protein [Paracoccus marinaquae]|uniref:Response regulator transcription factor n=1 Tax=Paracoccus marinaquae TaxID=2841926 RepID=A0ABS6AP27_9RHOB|nr:response regulator transcription factor [Paracoccus marinaquae]MBU3031872.1 response regulator transcription factor [Paracoccus marinaquae]